MENAHLRLGRLTFVRQTRDTITHISAHLDRFIAEPVADGPRETSLHLASVFGGHQEIGAMLAAVHEQMRVQIDAGGSMLLGTFGEKPVVYRSSLQIPGRKRPVRHAVILSKALFETTFGANSEARRTVLFDHSPDFVLHRLAVRFGLPVLPEWAIWFTAELRRRGLVEELIGFNCAPIAVRATKLRLLRILGQGLRRKAIGIPAMEVSRAVSA
jgi:hypothetical protein